MKVGEKKTEEVADLRRLAEQGDAAAQYDLGLAYRCGGGVPKDYVEAARWFRLAAEQGDVTAQFILGSMYDSSNIGPMDCAEAVKWWRLAAEQGHVDAQCFLGLMYMNGEGVPKNYIEAYKWLSLSKAGVEWDEKQAEVFDTLQSYFKSLNTRFSYKSPNKGEHHVCFNLT